MGDHGPASDGTPHDPCLRVQRPGLAPGTRASFNFNGARIGAFEGESIAAALAASNIVTLGRRRDGAPRGLWCGMGVCQECLVTVDGTPGIRACMAAVSANSIVTSQGYEAPVRDRTCATESRSHDIDTRNCQVLIVGAGPAGLAAAEAAARCGARITVLDERATLGGQYFKQPAKSHRFVDPSSLDPQVRDGRRAISKVRSLDVELINDAAVWGAFGRHELAAHVAGVQTVFAPERLIVATGLYERGIPMPGWTLPGYMTTGAVQTLLRAYSVLPGRRILVAGNGPLNLQLAAELVEAGASVVAVVEAALRPGPRHFANVAQALRATPELVLKGLHYLAVLRRAKIPLFYQSAVVQARGATRVERCVVARIDATGRSLPDSSIEFEVDTVCAGYGFRPSNELLRALGCRHAVKDQVLSTLVDANGLTSVEGVYAVGDVVGLMGAHAARSQGFIAGCAAARSLGLVAPRDVTRDLERATIRLRRQRRFQQALWRLFAAPPLSDQFALAETLFCRCENVDRASVAAAIRCGTQSLGAIKRRTRAGMGRCQGRYCEPLLAAALQGAGVSVPEELDYFAPRVPIKPVRIDELA